MRVLFVIAHLDKGGGQALQSVQLYRRILSEVDGHLLCLSAYGGRGGVELADGVEVVGRLRFPNGIRDLARHIRDRRGSFDLVQAFDFYYSLPAARLAGARPLVVRIGSHPVGDFEARYGLPGAVVMRLVNPWMYRGTQVVVNGRHLLEAFPPGRARWIPNGVDVDRFAPRSGSEAARRDLGLPAGVPLAVYTGKVTHRKNVEELFWLLQELPDLHLLLVGHLSEPYYGPEYYHQLRARYPGVIPRVHAVGEVPPDRVPRHLEAGDLFVFPSKDEGMPNSVLEAMSAALPVVASDIPPHRDVVPESAGILYRTRPELKAAVVGLLGDGSLRRGMGERGREHARERFSFAATCRAYLDVYRELLHEA